MAIGRMRDGGWVRVASLAAVTSLLLLASTSSMAPRLAAAQEAPTAQAVALRMPEQPAASEVSLLQRGVAASDAGDWATLAMLRDSARDPLIRKILQWRYASSSNAPASFAELSTALDTLQGWPGRAGMRARAEQTIFSSALSPRERVAFFDRNGAPETGDGKIALAVALRETGRRDEAQDMARAAWRTDELSATAEAEALAAFSGALSQSDHAARVDALIWRGQRGDARRLMPRIGPADRAVALARITLQERPRRGVQTAVDAVPSARQDDPGLLFERARYVRRAGRPEDALPIAARINPLEAPMLARARIFEERRLYVSRALRGGSHATAYQLVANHGLTSGEAFADGEWLAGWISLRFRNDPGQALERFSHLAGNVSSPVSRSRALYWRAQAERALGRNADSQTHLREAAQLNYTYYGQLAANQVGGGQIALANSATVSNEARLRFENRELVRALRLMANIGDRADFESLAFYLDDTLEDPQEIEALSQMARERAYYRTAVRSGKAGLFRGVVAANAAYPIMTLPAGATLPGRAEPAFVHAIIRQESEFDAGAVSSASARGLMQLMPATARMQAQREGMSYSGPAALTNDPDYNVTLGAAHLGDLVRDFNGSYVLAAAAYNAGSHRAREWITDWGDPRSPSVDVVDWVELIPFAETRNYVQRVMENLQVYRHRLSGTPTQITLEQDLRRGGY